jgi:hypothetical protein
MVATLSVLRGPCKTPPDAPLRGDGKMKGSFMPSTTTDAYAALRNPIVRRFAFGRFGAVLGLQMLSVSVGGNLRAHGERVGPDSWAPSRSCPSSC